MLGQLGWLGTSQDDLEKPVAADGQELPLARPDMLFAGEAVLLYSIVCLSFMVTTERNRPPTPNPK